MEEGRVCLCECVYVHPLTLRRASHATHVLVAQVSVCVRVCVLACVRAWVRAWVRACVCVFVLVFRQATHVLVAQVHRATLYLERLIAVPVFPHFYRVAMETESDLCLTRQPALADVSPSI